MNSTWLRRFTTTAADGPILVCFPHAGGSATAFKDLARVLHPDVDVVSVQYPGRQDRYREEPFTALEPLAEAVTEELARELAADGRPYALFGHSMGSLVAFETARRLAQRRLPAPQRVFFSGRGGPDRRDSAYDLYDDADMLAEVRRLGGTDQSMLEDPDILELVLPALRADYRILGTYRGPVGGGPLTSPVTALIGDSDPLATVQDAHTWREHTSGDFRVEVFPGGHFYLFDQLEKVAAAVTEGLLTRAAAS
ncbi:thioesterase II family protein [Streptomyces sp. NPDC058122]|uniref:thioesterase II family protein n=1 Tax=Streptomyces sp. NPDC058122 TaxID=3346349 RepID=UPI0036E7EEED